MKKKKNLFFSNNEAEDSEKQDRKKIQKSDPNSREKARQHLEILRHYKLASPQLNSNTVKELDKRERRSKDASGH